MCRYLTDRQSVCHAVYTAPVATQAERSAATRRRLLDAARERFVTIGYEPTSTEQIRQLAGVSRGAMYHHFGSKRDLFEAVFEEVAVDAIRQAISEADTDESPLGQLTAASLAWLRVVRDRQVATILIEQAPNVLGWRQARAVEERTTLGLMRGALDRAVAAGEIDVV